MTQPIVYEGTREEIFKLFWRIVMAILMIDLLILVTCFMGCRLIEFETRMQQRQAGPRIRIFRLPEVDDEQ